MSRENQNGRSCGEIHSTHDQQKREEGAGSVPLAKHSVVDGDLSGYHQQLKQLVSRDGIRFEGEIGRDVGEQRDTGHGEARHEWDWRTAGRALAAGLQRSKHRPEEDVVDRSQRPRANDGGVEHGAVRANDGGGAEDRGEQEERGRRGV